jgi:hypothetical protein
MSVANGQLQEENSSLVESRASCTACWEDRSFGAEAPEYARLWMFFHGARWQTWTVQVRLHAKTPL